MLAPRSDLRSTLGFRELVLHVNSFLGNYRWRGGKDIALYPLGASGFRCHNDDERATVGDCINNDFPSFIAVVDSVVNPDIESLRNQVAGKSARIISVLLAIADEDV